MTITKKRQNVEEVTIKMAKYIIATHNSMGKTAKVFNVSTTAILYRVHRILPQINREYYDKILEIIKDNSLKQNIDIGIWNYTLKANTIKKIDNYIYKTLVENKDKEWVKITVAEMEKNADVARNCIKKHVPTILKDSFCRYERREYKLGSALHYEYKLKINKELL